MSVFPPGEANGVAWTSYHVSERNNGYLKGEVQVHTELRLTKFGTSTLSPDPWFNSDAEWNWISK